MPEDGENQPGLQKDIPIVKAAMDQGASPVPHGEGWTKAEIGFFKFENVGDFFEGVLLRKEWGTVSGTRVGKYQVQDINGGRYSFNGTTQLDELLSLVPPGSKIFVHYIGSQVLDNGQEMKRFEVQYKTR